MQFKALFVFSALLAAVATTTGALPTALEARAGNLTAGGISKFTLTVASTSSNVEQLMVVLNPKLIAPQGVDYQNYFPVVWKVLRFTANALPLVGKPKPISVSYASDITVILQQITMNNIVNSADYEPVTTAGEEFLINDLGGGQYNLIPAGKVFPQSSAAINNPIPKSFDVGLGDSNGNSYLTMSVPYQDTLAFTFDAEFAVVPVGPTVQDSTKLVTGTVLKPWFSFRLSDLTSESPSFTFDGTNINDVNGISKISNHGSDEPVFG